MIDSNIEYAVVGAGAGAWIGYAIGFIRGLLELKKNKKDYDQGYEKGRKDEFELEHGVSIDPPRINEARE